MRSLWSRPLIALLVVTCALLACKKKQEETAPSADTATPAPPEPSAATTETAPTAEPSAAAPTTPQPVGTVKPKTDAGAKDAAAAPSDAGTAASDASAGKNAACQAKCNGIMQACLTPSAKEGGLPSFADPTKCRAAFDECAKACK